MKLEENAIWNKFEFKQLYTHCHFINKRKNKKKLITSYACVCVCVCVCSRSRMALSLVRLAVSCVIVDWRQSVDSVTVSPASVSVSKVSLDGAVTSVSLDTGTTDRSDASVCFVHMPTPLSAF